MARLVNKLSALKVARLDKAGWYCDGDGLWLQVSPTGSKSWVFRFAIAGKRHHMGLRVLSVSRLLDSNCIRYSSLQSPYQIEGVLIRIDHRRVDTGMTEQARDFAH